MLDLEKIDGLMVKLAGIDSVPLTRLIIEGKENVSEFLLAEKLELGINQVRNMLYRLQKYNLVTSMRKKDKKKGWYIYYWTFNTIHANSLLVTIKDEELTALEKRLKREEESDYYTCSKKCMRLNFINAMDNDFKCPICEGIVKQVDNSKIIKQLRKEIEELRATEVDPEIISEVTSIQVEA